MIRSYHRLRKIKDELNIKIETRVIILTWVVFSFLYFGTLEISYDMEGRDL